MKIGVYGSASGEVSDEVSRKAREIGRQIAMGGHTLVTGGCPGLPYDAVLGASEIGGECIGYSPATDLEMHRERDGFPVEGFTDFVFVPKEIPADYIDVSDSFLARKLRVVALVSAVDAGIIVGGETGTMDEFVILYDLGKNIGILEGSGGITPEAIPTLLRSIKKYRGSKIIYDPNPILLVDRVVDSLR